MRLGYCWLDTDLDAFDKIKTFVIVDWIYTCLATVDWIQSSIFFFYGALRPQKP